MVFYEKLIELSQLIYPRQVDRFFCQEQRKQGDSREWGRNGKLPG